MQPVLEGYRARAAELREHERAVSRSIGRMGAVRLGVFAAAVLLFAAAVAYPQRRLLCGALCAAAFVGFAALVRRSARLRLERRRVHDLAELNEQAAYRVERDWAHVRSQRWDTAESDDVALDLDLFGPRGLTALLPPVTQALGQPRIRSWLGGAAPAAELELRQLAVRELADAWTFRDELAVRARHARASAETIARFRAWALDAPAPRAAWIGAASFIVPALTISLFAVQLAGFVAAPLWLYSVAAALVVVMTTRRAARERLRPVAEMSVASTAFAEMVAVVEAQEFTSARLSALRASLCGADGSSAAASLSKLADIGALAETSASPMLHATLQAIVLWDLHVARKLDAWRATHGPHVGAWLDALGEIEGLAALAAIAHGNPDWTYPRLSDAEPTALDARGLGHPLLSPSVRVANDLVVGPPGMVQLISGSNMSGKSTLLRAVGLNVVLALAGGPVCAESMRCPLVRLRTSIQVHDSLAEGVSYFMAELRRLKTIIDDASSGGEAGVRPTLYLIDEILRGTNSEERAVAARMIVRRLLATNAIGIITSHDLAMFADPALAPHIVHHHLRETIDAGSAGDRMRFDYRLLDGPATSRNALRLLALVGIGDAPV
jgi:hypothetical protein